MLNNAHKWFHLGCYDKRNTLLYCFHGDFFTFLSHKNVTLAQQCCHASAEQCQYKCCFFINCELLRQVRMVKNKEIQSSHFRDYDGIYYSLQHSDMQHYFMTQTKYLRTQHVFHTWLHGIYSLLTVCYPFLPDCT